METLREARLELVRYLAPGVNLYEFTPLDGEAPGHEGAGSHLDLHLPDGSVRQYSLVTLRGDRYVVAVQRDAGGRGASRYLHDRARVGEVFRVGALRNRFALSGDASHSVLIAGGIGVTPLLSMVEELESRAASWELHYSSVHEHPPFLDRLQHVRDRVKLYRGRVLGPLRLNIAQVVGSAPSDSTFYCCGPQRMLDAFRHATADLPAHRARHESFHASAARATDGGFVVVLARRGVEVPVPPGKTILDCLIGAGVNAPRSCLQGICGQCETRVLGGRPDHRDGILSAAERAANNTMMVCCSGSLDPTLVLDL